MSTQHAVFSPSASHRWMRCTSSIKFIDKLREEGKIPKEDTATKYAQEGTVAHTIAEQAVREKLLDEMKTIHGDEEMELHAEEYANYIAIILNEKYKGGEVAVATEQRTTLKAYPDECFGTVDCYTRNETRLDVFDYKYGKGVAVRAKDNPQLLIYAFSLFTSLTVKEQTQIKEVGVHIIQPRIGNIDGHYITVEELKAFGEKLTKKIDNIKYNMVTFEGGDHCRFCPALVKCREYYWRKVYRKIDDDADFKDEELEDIIEKAEEIHAYITKLKTYVTETIRSGGVVKGFKLVAGVRRRQITDEQKAVELLERAGYNRETTTITELKGFTELEKICGKKAFTEICGEVITYKEGQPVLAKEDDKRPAVATFSIPQELL